jgi:hypothetical protein
LIALGCVFLVLAKKTKLHARSFVFFHHFHDAEFPPPPVAQLLIGVEGGKNKQKIKMPGSIAVLIESGQDHPSF